jgi:hypothetical protein
MVRRSLVLAVLAAISLSSPVSSRADDDDLAKAARSPFQLERFLRTHTGFDWKVLWKALDISDKNETPFLGTCEEPGDCTAEMAWSDGSGTILRLNHTRSDFSVFLRFHREGQLNPLQDNWKFLGYYQPNVKYFRPVHRVLSVEGLRLLSITEQGGAGSGLSVELNNLFDLSRPGFTPVLSFVEHGHFSDLTSIPGREVSGFLASVEPGRPDVIKIHYIARHFAYDVPLGRTQADAVYTRTGRGKFRFDPKQSSTSEKEIDALYVRVDGLEDVARYSADFLRCNFANLKQIASGPPTPARRWLKGFLKWFPDTAQSHELQQLLSEPPAGR